MEKLFKDMTNEEVTEYIAVHPAIQDYSKEKYEELVAIKMAELDKKSLVYLPTVMVASSEGDKINTGITLERLLEHIKEQEQQKSRGLTNKLLIWGADLIKKVIKLRLMNYFV